MNLSIIFDQIDSATERDFLIVEQEHKILQNSNNAQKKFLFLDGNLSLLGLIKWLEKNPKDIELISNPTAISIILSVISDEFIKTKLNILVPKSSQISNFYSLIEDKFLKTKFSESLDITSNYTGVEKNKKLDILFYEIDKYQEICNILNECKTENETVDKIITLKDNDMKISLLDRVKDQNNRYKIINSLTRNVSPDIAKIDKVTKNAILLFYYKAYNGKLPDDKNEALLIELNRTNCLYGNTLSEYDAVATFNTATNQIILDEKYKDKPILFQIGILLHEWSHKFSTRNHKIKPEAISHIFEESNADIFSELVLNSAIQRFAKQEIMQYEANSPYVFENSLTKTLLYPLEQNGKDIEAICEYTLGDKNKFFELTIPSEILENYRFAILNNFISIDTWVNILSNINQNSYINPNFQSIYFVGNKLIDLFVKRDTTKQPISAKDDLKNKLHELKGKDEEENDFIEIIF